MARNKFKGRAGGGGRLSETNQSASGGIFATTPDLLAAAGKLSFNNPLGGKVELGFPSDPNNPSGTGYYVPGVCALSIAPYYGKSTTATSALNVAATNAYHFVRYANSGSRNYETPDLMIYLIAMDSLYSLYAYMARAYGVLNIASQWNRYIPKSLFTSMGLDFDDFSTHISDFNYYINNFGVRMSALAVPASMRLYEWHQKIFSSVFADGGLSKSALYVYVPYGFYQYTPVAEETGGSLTFVPLNTSASLTPLTFEQLRDYAEKLLGALLNDEDSGIISGDIMKAYGTGSLYSVARIPQDYVVVPVYDGSVLDQIQNSLNLGLNLTGAAAIATELNYTQSGGILINKGTLTIDADFAPIFNGNRILTAKFEDPTPDDVMWMTRLTPAVSASATTLTIEAAGTELLVGVRIYQLNGAVNGSPRNWRMYLVTDGANDLYSLGLLTKFKRHPMTFVSTPDGGQTDTVYIPYGDLDNYTVVEGSVLAKLHETALLSLFNVPQMS